MVRDGQIIIRKMMNLSITLDHRIVDGATAARFLNLVIEYLSAEPAAPRGHLTPVLPAGQMTSPAAGEVRPRGSPTPTRSGRAGSSTWSTPGREVAPVPELPEGLGVRLLEAMLFQRALDQRMLNLQRQGRIGFYGTAKGQEGATLGTGAAFEADDWVFPALREGAIALWRGFPLELYVAQCFGQLEGRDAGAADAVPLQRRAAPLRVAVVAHRDAGAHAVGRRAGRADPEGQRGRRRVHGRRRDERGRLPRGAQLRGRLEGARRVRLPEQPVGDLGAGAHADRDARPSR